jgi:hypothetical protein
LLRASGQFTGDDYDLDGISSGDVADIGIPHAQLLMGYAEAVVGGDEARRRELGEAIVAALGEEGLVDAAGVIGTFNAIVRVADACGIPLEAEKEQATREMRARLGVDDFEGHQPDTVRGA